MVSDFCLSAAAAAFLCLLRLFLCWWFPGIDIVAPWEFKGWFVPPCPSRRPLPEIWLLLKNNQLLRYCLLHNFVRVIHNNQITHHSKGKRKMRIPEWRKNCCRCCCWRCHCNGMLKTSIISSQFQNKSLLDFQWLCMIRWSPL